MLNITIRSFAKFRELFGEINSITVGEGTSLLGALLAFAKIRSNGMEEIFSGAKLNPHIILMYNKERIDSNDAKTITLKDGDEIVLYPPVSGG